MPDTENLTANGTSKKSGEGNARKAGSSSKQPNKLVHRVSFSEPCMDADTSDEEVDPKLSGKTKLPPGKEPSPATEAKIPDELKQKPEGFFLKNPIDGSVESHKG